MSKKGSQLVTIGTTYGSQIDENMMFSWLDKIPCVSGYKGKGVELYIDLKEMDEDSLRELISLFFRYQLDLSQFKQFETSRNRKWFNNPEAYWYPYVFEDKTPTPLFGSQDKKRWDAFKNRIKSREENKGKRPL
jgi:hypothetical protein